MQTSEAIKHPEAVTPPRFRLGRIVATPGALAELEAADIEPGELIARHHAGDWGDVPKEDAEANEAGLRCGDRILSSYPIDDQGADHIWIITEADRSSTTVLLPSEY
jgi:hypothetical protein